MRVQFPFPIKTPFPPPCTLSLLPPPTPILHPLALPLTSAISGLHEVIRSLTPIFRILRLLGPDAHNPLRLTLRVTVRQPDLPSLWCVCVCARACVCARYFCDRSPPCSWAVVAPTSSCPCIRERLYQKKRCVRSNARNDNEHEHEHEHARIHTHTRTHYGLALLPGEFLRNEQRLLVGRRAVRPWLLVEARQQRGPERPVRKQGGSNNEPQSDDCVLHNDVCPCPRARQRARQRARHQLTRWPVQWTCLQVASENRASSWMATDSS